MVTKIWAFYDDEPTETDTYRRAAGQQRAVELSGLWLGQRQAGREGKIVAKRNIPLIEFEDSNEGKVFLAMKRGVLEWLSEAIKSRLNEEEPLNVAAQYADAIAALNQIDEQQDAEIGAAADTDLETE